MDFRTDGPRDEHDRRRGDRRKTDRGGVDRRTAGLAVIHWKSLDGTEASGHPLALAHAEALLRAFQSQFPLPLFWLETPPALDDAALRG